MGADGRVFSQHARTLNVSLGGALLCGIEHELKIGDTVGVRHGENKVRCKVVWAVNTQSTKKIQVGVQLLNKYECPWTALLPKAEGSVSISAQNRRRFERHKISVVIALHDERVTIPIGVTATDISPSGCYVETLCPSSIGTGFKVDLCIAEQKITTQALVRSIDPGLGMGIEFIGLKPEVQQRFQEYLRAMDPWASSIERHDPGPRNAHR
jgi:hypothetical protein